MKMQQAFIFLTNKHAPVVLDLYHRLHTAAQAWGDTYLAYNQTTPTVPAPIMNERNFIFTNDIVDRMGYDTLDKRVYSNAHFVLLDFYLKNQQYDYYWFIEDDVVFNGSWAHLFSHFSESHIQPDLLACHIYSYQNTPGWCWWVSLYHPYQQVPMNLRIRSFHPVFRISNAALRFLHAALTDRWRGHHEVLIASLLYLEGFHVADFGGNGPFVIPGHDDRFYINGHISDDCNDGTMRFRPLIQPSEITVDNKLYHPVKPWA